MELVEGVPARTTWCATERLGIDDPAAPHSAWCATHVQHAHRALVVHRNLKPANIFVTTTGDVKLLDFGIAKLLDPSAWNLEPTATVTGLRPLTPGPRLLNSVVTETSRRPPTSTRSVSCSTSCWRVCGPAPRRARQAPFLRARGDHAAARRVRGDLNRIVLTALRDEPERRYVSAGQLGEEIGRFLDGRPVLAQPNGGLCAGTFIERRHRMGVAAAATLICCLTAFGVVATVQARALATQGRVAREERDKAERIVRLLVELFESTNPCESVPTATG